MRGGVTFLGGVEYLLGVEVCGGFVAEVGGAATSFCSPSTRFLRSTGKVVGSGTPWGRSADCSSRHLWASSCAAVVVVVVLEVWLPRS